MKVVFFINEEMTYEIDDDIIKDMNDEDRDFYIREQGNQWKDNFCDVEWDVIEE